MTRRIPILLALTGAYTLYVWMFLASDGLVTLASHGGCGSGAPDDVVFLARRFASDWRHGMTGEAPLYLPGFFLLSVVIWIWCRGRPWRRLVAEGLGALAVAIGVALVLAPLGTRHLIEAFEVRTGLACVATLQGYSIRRALLGAFTLVTWNIVVVGIHAAVVRRITRPLIAPALFGAASLVLRPPTHWPVLWAQRLVAGDLVAILSLILVPGVTVALIVWERRVHLHPRQATGTPRPG